MGKKLVQAEVTLPDGMTHASGNQIEHNTKTNAVYRTGNYKEYQSHISNSLEELADELNWKVPRDKALEVKLMFIYAIPKTLINTKKKLAMYQDGLFLPITRGTKDVDNSAKCVGDALQEAFDFDDSQIVDMFLRKRYGNANKLYVEISEV